MKNNLLLKLLLFLALYFGIKYFGGDIGRKVMYPVIWLVTFLHELGHGLGAIITGGGVEALQINSDGSGYTVTRGGSRAIILMGGYIGSALLGNFLFYIGARRAKWARGVMVVVGVLMAGAGLLWFNSLFTTLLLFVFAGVFIFIALKKWGTGPILMFLGMATILYIIEDFKVGPRSDLEQYAQLFVVIPTFAWMYIWLAIVLVITFFNLRTIWRSIPPQSTAA